MLVLKDPTHFAGVISKSGGSLDAGDVVDVAGFDASATVDYSGTGTSGTVTISEAGHTTVHLHVGANSTHWSAPVSDGHGGILIHDPPDDSAVAPLDGRETLQSAVEPPATPPTVIAATAADHTFVQELGPVVMHDPGTAPGQTFVASTPNHTLTGSGAGDTFVFNFGGFGHDTITNFNPAGDMLQFHSAAFANVQAALDATHDDGHGGTVVTIDGPDTIKLEGALKAQLHAADYHVV